MDPNDEPPHVERIVLYVDDLDRCPANQVVEVLQAVHLMLSFKLFVVVVGVDSRWLLHSLEEYYAAQLSTPRHGATPGSKDTTLANTPHNYLEKIFQIPFTMSPMKKAGFGSLIDSLVSPPVKPIFAPDPHLPWSRSTRPTPRLLRRMEERTPSAPRPARRDRARCPSLTEPRSSCRRRTPCRARASTTSIWSPRA